MSGMRESNRSERFKYFRPDTWQRAAQALVKLEALDGVDTEQWIVDIAEGKRVVKDGRVVDASSPSV